MNLSPFQIIVSPSDEEILIQESKSLFPYIADCRQEISAHYKSRFVSC
jgi:hypothetical protein